MRVVDDVILARLKALDDVDDEQVHDGLVMPPSSEQIVVITYKLPYVVYRSNIGDDSNPRLSARRGRRSVFFDLTIVGEDRWQVKWLGEKIRTSLNDRRILVPGHRTWLCRLEESTRIFRDDDALRPDGAPLFYAVDSYALPITLIHTQQGATA